jgi:hypothetical protein
MVYLIDIMKVTLLIRLQEWNNQIPEVEGYVALFFCFKLLFIGYL